MTERIGRLHRGGGLVLAGCLALSVAMLARGQGAGVAIESGIAVDQDQRLVHAAEALRKAGKLMDETKVEALLAAPRPEKLALPEPATQPLPARDVYRRARAAFLRIGWYYHCPDCGQWHINLGAAYAIADGGVVATAAHTLTPDDELQGVGTDAFLVAFTADNRALPVTSILAEDEALDAAIARVGGFTGTPLALAADVAPGDAAYCFSDPLDVRGYFSVGTVNRFYWLDEEGGDPASLAGIAGMRLNVSTDWAPGSSGAAVLDAAGNAIGHVSAISPVCDLPSEETAEEAEPAEAGSRDSSGAGAEPGADRADPEAEAAEVGSEADRAPMFQLHDAIPARGVLLLAEAMEHPAPGVTAPTAVAWRQKLQELVEQEAANSWTQRRLLRQFDEGAAAFRQRFPKSAERWRVQLLELDADALRDEPAIGDVETFLGPVLAAEDVPADIRQQARRALLEQTADCFPATAKPPDVPAYIAAWETRLAAYEAAYPEDTVGDVLETHLAFLAEQAPACAEPVAQQYAARKEPAVAAQAREVLKQVKVKRELAGKPLKLAFTALDGRKVDLSRLRGKVVLVDFWATWCGPCMEEVPRVVKAFSQYKDQGLAVIGISLDDDKSALERIVKKKGMRWPQKFSGQGWDDPLVKQYGIDGIPTMWLVNRAGRIADWDAREDLDGKIRKLLAEP